MHEHRLHGQREGSGVNTAESLRGPRSERMATSMNRNPSGEFRHRMRRTAILLCGAGSLALLLCAIILTPKFVVAFDSRHSASLNEQEYLRAVHDARTAVLQTVGGIAVVLGAYATWRRLQINEDEIRVARDGQVTERFGRAIDQLGAENRDVRIGGIFGLERIGRNSIRDRDSIIAILSALVRTQCTRASLDPEPDDGRTLAVRASDAQAAMTVLGRLPRDGVEERIRVPNTDLRFARLWQLDLGGALLGRTDLRGARLWEASLVKADLGTADLRGADLTQARLDGAWLVGADLRGARLDDTCLEEVLCDRNTLWPDGFNPGAHGVRLLSDDERDAMKRRRV